LCAVGSVWAQNPFEIHGYIQGRFTDQLGTPDRLEIRRARLLVTGNPFSHLSYRFQVDFAKKPYLMDSSLAWKFGEALTLTAGQFKIPFSAESIIADNLNAPVSRSRAVLSLAPGRDTGVQGRDTGGQVSGSLHAGNGSIMDYSLGVFRGQTLIYSPQVHYRAVAGRVMVHPIHGLSTGFDWYGSFQSTSHLPKRREDVEGEYVRGRLRLRAEQIFARDGTLDRRGGYGVAVWRLFPRWEILSRADWLTTNVDKANTTSIAYIAGGNFIIKHAKIGFDTGAQHNQGPQQWSSVMVAQVMLSF
jgi:hypothetical protein